MIKSRHSETAGRTSEESAGPSNDKAAVSRPEKRHHTRRTAALSMTQINYKTHGRQMDRDHNKITSAVEIHQSLT